MKSAADSPSTGAPFASVTLTKMWRTWVLPAFLRLRGRGGRRQRERSGRRDGQEERFHRNLQSVCDYYTTMKNERRLADGRVELIDTRRVEASPLYNDDLAPVPLARRNWTTYNYAALWISMAHCIPTYMLASGLMASGMNWWQALVTILLGNTIVLVPILLNSHPGTKYGIPFPVFARAAYGTLGSNVPALMRALVACGWFGIQAWIGGEALQHVLHDGRSPAGRRCSAPASPATRRPSGSRSCCSGA